MTIIKLDYEDIKPALSIDQKGFEKENIVPGSIRAYKEFGQSMKVDGMRFGVTNLVTFEAKLKGEDLPYRTTCVMDDSGRVRGFWKCRSQIAVFRWITGKTGCSTGNRNTFCKSGPYRSGKQGMYSWASKCNARNKRSFL